MHPHIGRQLADARTADLHRNAAKARLVRAFRRRKPEPEPLTPLAVVTAIRGMTLDEQSLVVEALLYDDECDHYGPEEAAATFQAKRAHWEDARRAAGMPPPPPPLPPMAA